MVKVQTFGFGKSTRLKFFSDVRSELSDDLHSPDMEELAQGGKRTMAAMGAASRIAVDSYKELASREGEILKRTSRELADALHCAAERAVGRGSQECADDHKARIETAIQEAMKDMRSLGTTAKETNKQAFDILSVRMREHVRELKKLAKD